MLMRDPLISRFDGVMLSLRPRGFAAPLLRTGAPAEEAEEKCAALTASYFPDLVLHQWVGTVHLRLIGLAKFIITSPPFFLVP